MQWKIILDGIIFAFQLLSTVPFKKQVAYEEKEVRVSIISYPIVGAVLGLLLVSSLYILEMWTNLSLVVIALFLVTFGVIFSGGLHIDGWMDCSDAFFSYKSKPEKLKIMEDSRIGAFAAIALLFLFAWKFVFVYEVIQLLTKAEYLLIAFIPFLSRMNMGLKLYFGKLARKEGMAFSMRKYSKKQDSFFYFLMIAVIFILIYLLATSLSFYVIGLVISSAIFLRSSMKLDEIAFGGMTGDTLGASVEGGELWLWMTLYLLLSFATG